MADVMLYGVLRMPFDMAMGGEFAQRQFYTRAREAARRLEAAEARLAEIDAAIASRPAKVDDWMPFDTAPRDGSTFLATNGKLVTSCRYINEPGYVREVRDMDGRYIDQEESDGFEGFMDDEGGLPDLSHWQPYPSAPSHTTNKEKGGANGHVLDR